jgi:hypothetical protein
MGVHLAHGVGQVADPGLVPGDAGEGCGVCGTPHPANYVCRPLPARRGKAYSVSASVHPIALMSYPIRLDHPRMRC